MTKEERVVGFHTLGEAIQQLTAEEKEDLFLQTAHENPWFTFENIERSLKGVQQFLNEATLNAWLYQYALPNKTRQIGLIMAGNIPLVGFHDFLCVLISGHVANIKMSSQDTVLLNAIIDILTRINPDFGAQITIIDRLPAVEAVIATGSDNSARYFEKYFKDVPHIIRKNRTSVAVLDGHETAQDLQLLGYDIFSYFGLGCRNVAKIFIPKGYDMTLLLDALQDHQNIFNHPKYFNNYEYNKAIYLVNRTPHLDCGFAIFKEDQGLVSPLAVVYYEEYTNPEQLQAKLNLDADKLQCVVGSANLPNTITIPFGKSQLPEIDDYADNVDTMAFLCGL